MQLFTAITEDGFVFEETKAKIAKEITRITTTIMKVPASFVRVAFLSSEGFRIHSGQGGIHRVFHRGR